MCYVDWCDISLTKWRRNWQQSGTTTRTHSDQNLTPEWTTEVAESEFHALGQIATDSHSYQLPSKHTTNSQIGQTLKHTQSTLTPLHLRSLTCYVHMYINCLICLFVHCLWCDVWYDSCACDTSFKIFINFPWQSTVIFLLGSIKFYWIKLNSLKAVFTVLVPDDQHQMTVTVLLDGDESTIEFMDPPDRNVSTSSIQVQFSSIQFNSISIQI
jgi:hypothetical protein